VVAGDPIVDDIAIAGAIARWIDDDDVEVDGRVEGDAAAPEDEVGTFGFGFGRLYMMSVCPDTKEHETYLSGARRS
jgi:hypothetical protein